MGPALRNLSLIFLFVLSSIVPAQNSRPLPVDKNVTMGTLKNGIKYYIRVNHKPEKRAELRLVVNAGSVLEDDSQNGLAHFTEHMAFNGSKHFKKNELVDYLESIGVKFGPELNAFTSFDETVYMLQVPTDNTEIMKKAFLVLEDWAHNLSLEDGEIDKERGVIIEEWRLGRGAQARMFDKQAPKIFYNSQYAKRNVIGEKNILESFKYDELKRFYRDWYRPDLMAVVAVGDFDPEQIKSYIAEHFEDIPVQANPKERKLFEVPPHKETLFALAADKEATRSTVSVYFKHPKEYIKTEEDYRKRVIAGLFSEMMNMRFQELSKLPEPPFVFAFTAKGSFVRTSDVTYLSATVKDGEIENGLRTLLREAERVRLYGYTATELERTKKEIMRGMEQALSEKDKTESSSLVWEYVNNFLEGEPATGIENDYELYKKFMPGITVEEVNKLASELMQKDNRVVVVGMPEKEGLAMPSEESLMKILDGVSKENITAYTDKVANTPLISKTPVPGKIVGYSRNEKLGTAEWKLSNGVRVVVKPTDFKNDEISFNGFMPGGISLAGKDNYVSAALASNVAGESGVGEFSIIELQKLLAGKIANVNPYITSMSQGISGGGSPNDAETLFQLIYKYISEPRMDSAAYLSYFSRAKTNLKNKENDPTSAFYDTLSVTLNNYHYSSLPWTVERLNEFNLSEARKFYSDRFSDAGKMTFVFVGTIDTLKIKPLVETYLASLPATGKNESWRDPGIRYPKGVVEKSVRKGIEPKSTVYLNFSGDYNWDRHNEFELESLVSVLDIKLREAVREDKGGSYGVSVRHNIMRIPVPRFSINIQFGCAPERVEELTRTVFQVFDSLKQFGPTELVVNKVKEIDKKQREVNLKKNGFWRGFLTSFYSAGDDPMVLFEYNKFVDNLKTSDIQRVARLYLDEKNYVKCVLYPEARQN